MARSGRCMCGEVTFTVEEVSGEATACHCGMCTRWAGGPWIGTMAQGLKVQADEQLRFIKSSEWAERGFCQRCGSGLFFRMTRGTYAGNTSVSLGSLEDRSGITLAKEFFIDEKPETYAFAGERDCMTAAQIMAAFGDDI